MPEAGTAGGIVAPSNYPRVEEKALKSFAGLARPVLDSPCTLPSTPAPTTGRYFRRTSKWQVSRYCCPLKC